MQAHWQGFTYPLLNVFHDGVIKGIVCFIRSTSEVLYLKVAGIGKLIPQAH
jgi:hypothetical protein